MVKKEQFCRYYAAMDLPEYAPGYSQRGCEKKDCLRAHGPKELDLPKCLYYNSSKGCSNHDCLYWHPNMNPEKIKETAEKRYNGYLNNIWNEPIPERVQRRYAYCTYMLTKDCNRGCECTFAHKPEDLHQYSTCETIQDAAKLLQELEDKFISDTEAKVAPMRIKQGIDKMREMHKEFCRKNKILISPTKRAERAMTPARTEAPSAMTPLKTEMQKEMHKEFCRKNKILISPTKREERAMTPARTEAPRAMTPARTTESRETTSTGMMPAKITSDEGSVQITMTKTKTIIKFRTNWLPENMKKLCEDAEDDGKFFTKVYDTNPETMDIISDLGEFIATEKAPEHYEK